MNKLINVNIRNENGKLLVSSRDIAKGLEKEHKHVLSKIREVLNGSEYWPVDYTDEKGESRPEYMLDKNAFILLVMNYTGYNNFKIAYIKRFDEMEKWLSVNIPQSFPEALRCLAAEVEQRELMQKQRDEAIRTKAWISDKKTATAMNTASKKSKEVEKLKIELDRSKK
ncbi:MAG: Rha family transcriptional regulator, partial [Bacilli bacterium]